MTGEAEIENIVDLAEQIDTLLRAESCTAQQALAALTYTTARIIHGCATISGPKSTAEAIQLVNQVLAETLRAFATVEEQDERPLGIPLH